jgi:HEAT repeat protein
MIVGASATLCDGSPLAPIRRSDRMRSLTIATCAMTLACELLSNSARAGECTSATGSQDDLGTLTPKLKDPDEKVRRQAIEDLARLKTTEAWALVVESLADRSPLVADEAQLRLAEIADAAALKLVWGKAGLGSKDAVVQQRAAEAIGRLEIEVDGVALSKGLSAREPDTRRTVAHAIERLADAGKLEKKSRSFARHQLDLMLKNDKDPNVRAAALPARHAVEKFTVSDLFESLAKKDAGVVRAAATHTLASVDFGAIPGLYNETLESEELCAMRALVAELYEHASTSSVASLSSVLGRYPSLRLGWRIIDYMRYLSGEFDKTERTFWRTWARSPPSGWKPKKPPAQPVELTYVTKAELLGQPVITDHLTILIDVTGWPVEKGVDGSPLRARVRAAIGKMLGNLPEDSQFNVVFYASTPAAWEKGLVDATPANIKRALKSFDDCALTGEDNFLEAAALALSDKKVDTILVITDSAPSGAHHVHPSLVLEEWTQRNRFQLVVVDAVLLHADAESKEQWKNLCSPSGGRVTTASL